MSDIITSEFVNKYKDKQPNWGFNGLGYIVYKRTYARLKDNGQTEEWYETVQRCVNGAQKIGAKYTKEEAEKLYDYIFNLKGNFAGRMLWQLGTSTVDRFGANSLLNCWYVSINSPEAFCFLFENLMLGGGVGYSVKREHIHDLPKVKNNVKISHLKTNDASFIVPDSREGWIELLRKVLESFFTTGKSFTYSTILIRGYGELIKGFGGTASGPGILIDGIDKICKIISDRSGKKLRSVDCLDICNIIGSIVVAGNVRRSAEIAIGDPDDVLYLRAKRWDLGNIPNYRAMSNNSIYVDSFDKIMPEIWDGYTGKGEPYGFINMKTSKIYGRLGEKRKDNCEGYNPCQPSSATILTKEGVKTFGELSIGDIIWSNQGWTTVINKWSTGINKVYKYSTNGGFFLGTEAHRVVSNEEKIQAKDAESIDIITGPYTSKEELSPQNIMDGLVIGDGSVHAASNNLVYLYIGDNDRDYFDSEIKHLIGVKREAFGPTAHEIETTLTYVDVQKTYLRGVPDKFKYADSKTIKGFLRGLYSANGSVVDNRITLKASSKDIIEDVQLMLSSIGIRSYYTTNKGKLTRFNNGEYYCKESYDLNITVDRDKFIESIGFIQKYKTEKLNDIVIKQQKAFKSTYDIKSIEFISEEETFDITVNNSSHTYWTQGCNVSNCAEIGLADYECCNLSEIYLNNVESKEELLEISKLLYKTQKAICALPFIHPETEKIVHKNMRIGLGVTGVCQSINKLEWLDEAYQSLREFDKTWSKENGWPESIKLTTIKPSGTLSLLAGATPGVHPAYDKYYLRRIRMSSGDKLVKACKDLGYHTEYLKGFDGVEDHATIVVTFPCHAGSEAIVAKNFSAIEQLELVKKMQTIWSDNSVSVTVYYKSEELDNIKQWLKDNLENSVKTVSFLLHSEHGFAQAPYQSITEDEYKEMIKHVKPLLSVIDDGVGSIDNQECSSGACPLK